MSRHRRDVNTLQGEARIMAGALRMVGTSVSGFLLMPAGWRVSYDRYRDQLTLIRWPSGADMYVYQFAPAKDSARWN